MNDIIKKPSSLVPPKPTNPIVLPPDPLSSSGATQETPTLKLPQKAKWPKIVAVVLLSTLLLLGAGLVAAYIWYQQALQPLTTEVKNITLKVRDGASLQEVSSDLENLGLVRSSLATQIYMRLNSADIQAGSYLFSTNQSVTEIVDWLNDGRVNTLKVTILPGRTLNDLKEDLKDYGFSQDAITDAFTKVYAHPLLKDKPSGVNLEGYVFPETYFMDADASVDDVLIRSFDEFQKRIDQGGIVPKLASLGFNLHQGITLASIITAEVSKPEDRRIVAQVFEKRLKIGMQLGSDVTYIYAAKQLGVEPSSSIDSPYNTRKYSGFPPGAIGNFNFSALEAVVNPASTSYLYFVAGDDGVTHYGYTLEEHLANVAKYCQKLCNN